MFPVDIKEIVQNPGLYKDIFKKRYLHDQGWVVDKILELYNRRKEIQKLLDYKRSLLNKLSKYYALLKLKDNNKISLEKFNEELKKYDDVKDLDIKTLKEEISILEKDFEIITKELIDLLYLIPNKISEKVPIGPDENHNIAVRYWGIVRVNKNFEDEFINIVKKDNFIPINVEKMYSEEQYEKYIKNKILLKSFIDKCKEGYTIYPNFEDILDFDLLNRDKIVPYIIVDYQFKHHYDLVKEFDIVDSDTAGKVAGSRFYYEKNKLVIYDLALSLFSLKFYAERGYNNILLPPYMLKKEIEQKIAYYEAFKEAIYHIKEEDLILNTSAEHPLVAYYVNKIIEKKETPIKILSWAVSFRKEAGSHGKDTKGIFRVHQFHKTELHIISSLEDDEKLLENVILKDAEDFYKLLNIPYRIVLICSGDMDRRAFLQYDMEVWFPAQNKYREIGSYATVKDWISRKINLKLRDKAKKEYVANIYGTGIPIQRTLCALLENYYDFKDNIIRIPDILIPYLGFEKIEKTS